MEAAVPFQLRFNQNLTDLNPVLAGEGLTHGDNPRWKDVDTQETYMIHYVRCGRGVLHYDGQTYYPHAGQLIVMPSGSQFCFYPEENGRWALRWVGFTGSLAHRFSELPPVVDAPPGTFLNLCDLNDPNGILPCRLASELFFLYSTLLKSQKQKPMVDTAEWVKDYVKKNYMHSISVATLAEELGLDPDYLTRKFKKKTNLNIQDYIMMTRMSNAKRYLTLGYSVKETAAMCGFSDASGFCQAFKKNDVEHRSPTQYQKFIIDFHHKRTGSAEDAAE